MNKDKENQPISLLIVDDKEGNLFSLEDLLEEEGRTIIKATSGNDALKIALSKDIALILLDVHMPEMDGFEVAKFLKSSVKTKYIPVIFVTAVKKEISDILKGYEEGGIDYILKPLDPAITKAKVNSFIQLYKQRKELEQKDLTLENLGLLVNNSPDIMCILVSNKKLIIEEINHAASRVLGYEPEELQGNSVFQYFYEKDKKAIRKLCDEASINEGLIIRNENKVKHKDGSFRWLTWSAVYKNEKWFANSKDITDQKFAEKALKNATEKLKTSNEDLQNFAHSISHDLQEPLRMVSSYTDLLAKRYKEKMDKDTDEFIHFIIDGTQRMSHMIQDLLKFSRVQTEAKPFHSVDMSQVIKDVTSDLSVAIEESEAEIMAKKLPEIKADSSQMIQVFQNLISNSIKFRKKEIKSHIEVDYSEKKNHWVFSVKDNGIGIDPEFSDRVFKIFQRLHTKEEYPGTGIGLAVCKRIVERHQGNIWFKSKVGKGSTFYFSISKNL